MRYHIVHIGRTHASNKIRDSVQLLFLLAKHTVKNTFYSLFREHSHIDCILWKNIFQQEVSHRLTSRSLLGILYHIVESYRRRTIEYHIKYHPTEVFFQSPFKLTFEHYLSDTLFHHICLRHIECLHTKAMYFSFCHNTRIFPLTTFIGMDDIYLMTLLAEFAHQIGINASGFDMFKARGHCQK